MLRDLRKQQDEKGFFDVFDLDKPETGTSFEAQQLIVIVTASYSGCSENFGAKRNCLFETYPVHFPTRSINTWVNLFWHHYSNMPIIDLVQAVILVFENHYTVCLKYVVPQIIMAISGTLKRLESILSRFRCADYRQN